MRSTYYCQRKDINKGKDMKTLNDETLLQAAVHFMLAVDCNEDITSFISAICLMSGSYYNLNIHYPTELASVLEFLQRCFFLINPEKGTKVVEKKNKKRLPVYPRVFNLISDLSDHEWRETS
ncbi:uncharacterized protein LOC130428865 [Triplophysa dalaica]|uniref:uncharacterized protein LOC130428865 n=1 Tax=Triplophysa dalaica TaxID=1582913 RepID=UPI0024DF3431|nr:uncharacterized protein LOC130428865 [Triplophysa dalaica]